MHKGHVTGAAVQRFVVARQGFEPLTVTAIQRFVVAPQGFEPLTVTAVQRFVVAPQGFEPRLSESESLVLPLNEGAVQGWCRCWPGALGDH